MSHKYIYTRNAQKCILLTATLWYGLYDWSLHGKDSNSRILHIHCQ